MAEQFADPEPQRLIADEYEILAEWADADLDLDKLSPKNSN